MHSKCWSDALMTPRTAFSRSRIWRSGHSSFRMVYGTLCFGSLEFFSVRAQYELEGQQTQKALHAIAQHVNKTFFCFYLTYVRRK